ncbi:late secretory pathway protein AVL9 homolog [Rhopilema esculentum]|uniref:late secretory pathway protein AVL9 homolog n=1 Tax=Rhopilema esculentum TaxID=499914 RepID=UPI0031D2A8CB
MEEENLNEVRPVLHIFVIGFHHQLGAQVEFVYPEFQESNLPKGLPVPWHPLLHISLPDGAHNFENDFTFFQLPQISNQNNVETSSVFGIACFQQISSSELLVKSADVTRTSVQKSVVILLRMPLFGFIHAKLSLITQAYFNEKDFSRTGILKDAYTALNQSLSFSNINDSMYLVGLNVGDLVLKLKQKALVLVKLLLLEKKVLFWGSPVGNVCSSIMSLLSLIPGCIRNLQKCGLSQSGKSKKDEYGLPLDMFGKDYLFQPYLAMQQMGSISSATGYVIGTSNVLFKHQSHVSWDVLVDLESNDMVINDGKLSQALSLTTEDLRFSDFLTSTVADYEKDSGISWDGSDEWIRLQFKYYFLCLLASTAPEKGNSNFIDNQFNNAFIHNWRSTDTYKKWCKTKHHTIENIHQGHPFEGGLSLSDLKLRIQSRIDALSISEESKEKIGAVVKKTGQVVGGALSSARNAFTSWRGWFAGLVEEINEEMQGSKVNVEFVNSNETELDGDSAELNQGMFIHERKGANKPLI